MNMVIGFLETPLLSDFGSEVISLGESLSACRLVRARHWAEESQRPPSHTISVKMIRTG